MCRDIRPKVIRHKVVADSWSLADVMCHLIQVEQQYRQRLQCFLVEERPYLPAIHPDPTAHNLQASAADLLDQFEAARQKTLAFLKDVGGDVWVKTAVHETQGEVTFHYLVQYLVDHDSEHLNQIIDIQKRLNATPDRNAQPAISE